MNVVLLYMNAARVTVPTDEEDYLLATTRRRRRKRLRSGDGAGACGDRRQTCSFRGGVTRVSIYSQ